MIDKKKVQERLANIEKTLKQRESKIMQLIALQEKIGNDIRQAELDANVAKGAFEECKLFLSEMEKPEDNDS